MTRRECILSGLAMMTASSIAKPIRGCIGGYSIDVSISDVWSESPVEYIEFDGTQYVSLDDIHPNYYTYMYIIINYQLTEIISGIVQRIGSSSMSIYLCTGEGYVQTKDTGIKADTFRHVLTIDGTTSPYSCFYDGVSIYNFYRSSNSIRCFTIGGVDNGGTFIPSSRMKFYGMSISRSFSTDTLEHNFVPWRVGEIGCIKDVVTGKKYYPSEAVVVGPDV